MKAFERRNLANEHGIDIEWIDAAVKRKITDIEWFAAWVKLGALCEYCGRRTVPKGKGGPESNAVSCDHRKPRSMGGTHERSNWAICCTRCNLAKATLEDTSFINLISNLRLAGDGLMDDVLNAMARARLPMKISELEHGGVPPRQNKTIDMEESR